MKFAKLFTVLSLVLVFTFMSVFVAQAAGTVAQAEPAPTLEDLFTTLKNLGGFALFVTALVNAGKRFGWVSDGDAQKTSLALNGAGLVALVFLQLFGKLDLVPVLDQNAGAVANVINAILALVFQLYVSRKGHENVLAGLPAIGKSFTGRKAGESALIEQIVDQIAE